MSDRRWAGFSGVECVFREDANRRRLPPRPKLPRAQPKPPETAAAPPPVEAAPPPVEAAPPPVEAAAAPPPEPAAAEAPRPRNGLRWWVDPTSEDR